MARTAAILRTLLRVGAREGKTLGSFSGNNIFYFAVASLFMSDTRSFVALSVLLAVVLFFPLSTDPLRKVPRSRLAVWPFTAGERRVLRLLTPWLNPVTWVLAALVLGRTVSSGLWALLAGLFAFGFLAPSLDLAANMPGFPLPTFPTHLNQLVRNNLRQMFSTLDFYAALLIAVGATLYRAFGVMPAEARLPITVLIVLALSSYAQSLFGLDGPGALTRYRLLPVRGWQIIAAKDAAFLLVNAALCLPLSPMPALSAAFLGLAIGNGSSIVDRRPQERWRFTSATSFGPGIIQVILMILAATATQFWNAAVTVLCAALCAGSTWRAGRLIERKE